MRVPMSPWFGIVAGTLLLAAAVGAGLGAGSLSDPDDGPLRTEEPTGAANDSDQTLRVDESITTGPLTITLTAVDFSATYARASLEISNSNLPAFPQRPVTLHQQFISVEGVESRGDDFFIEYGRLDASTVMFTLEFGPAVNPNAPVTMTIEEIWALHSESAGSYVEGPWVFELTPGDVQQETSHNGGGALLTTNRDKLAICVEAVGLNSSKAADAKPRVEAALPEVAEHPYWELAGLAAFETVVDVGCPSQPPEPAWPDQLYPIDAIQGHRVREPSPYRVFIFVLAEEELDELVAPLSTRRAPQELVCAEDIHEGCREVTTGVYLAEEEFNDSALLVRQIEIAVGLGSTREVLLALPQKLLSLKRCAPAARP